MKRFMLVFILVLVLATACTSAPTPTSAPLPTAIPIEEKYEKVDPRELLLSFDGSIKSAKVDSDGNIKQFEGKITRMFVGGKPIELVSDTIVLEGNDAFIVTRDYGKIKVSMDISGGITPWLKPSQKARLKELVK